MSVPSPTPKLKLRCSACGKETAFEQPYAYHAGFSDQAFLYDDAGTSALVFSAYDEEFSSVFGHLMPWTAHDEEKKKRFEAMLPLSPSGGRWRFSNPARCPHCGSKISGPMGETIYYLLYPGSVVVDDIRGLKKG
jgi:DNA-directed RNA polymerase subunit RPC12/RpoP